MTGTRPTIKDLWTTDASYQALYQGGDEVETVVRLLDVDDAAALADLGCGNGAFAIAAARRSDRLKVFAFDAIESAVAEARARAADLGARFVAEVAWVESVPLADASVDRVLCRSVLHHIADPQVAYAEMARVLRPGGRLLLQAPCNYWEESWGEFISELYWLMDDSHRRHYHQPGEIITALNAAGLRMRRADCWTFAFTELSEKQVELIRARGEAQRLNLRQTDGGWTIDLYWVRVLAEKDPHV